jgi:branched-chain amino acid transport system substrate-binding protein
MESRSAVIRQTRARLAASRLGALWIALVALSVASACGTRLDHAAVVLAAQGRPGSGLTAGGPGVQGGDAGNGATGTGPAVAAGGTPGSRSAGGSSGGSTAGGGGTANGGGGTAAAGGGTAAAAGTPIIIGSVGTQSGIVGASIAAGVTALQAWVASVNAGGGINGHPVKLVVADDHADPSQHRALVQQLVEQDHVVAFVYNDAPLTGQASVDYLTQKGVPVVGSELAGQWFYQSPVFFPQAATGLVLTDVSVRGVAQVVVPQGKTKVAFLTCVEAQYCVDASRVYPQIAPQVGFQVVANSSASLAQPDFTSQCLDAQSHGAQVFIMAMDTNSVGRVAANCASIGYHPIFSWASTVTVDRHRSDPNLEGAVLPLPSAPWFLSSNPAIAEFQAATAKYAPGLVVSGQAENGWVAGKLFEAAAKVGIGAGTTPTSQQILNGIVTIKNNNLAGLAIPLTFNKGQNAPPITCWFTATIHSGGWASPDAGRLNCK